MGDAGLAGARRPEQDHGRKRVGCDGEGEPAARADRVLLPAQLGKRARAHAHRKRRDGVFRTVVDIGEERVHEASYPRGRRWMFQMM